MRNPDITYILTETVYFDGEEFPAGSRVYYDHTENSQDFYRCLKRVPHNKIDHTNNDVYRDDYFEEYLVPIKPYRVKAADIDYFLQNVIEM